MFEPALGIERLGTIREISQVAKVAESTVHRVLKGRDKVSPATRGMVLKAVRSVNEKKISLASPVQAPAEAKPTTWSTS